MSKGRILLIVFFCFWAIGCAGTWQSTWDSLRRGSALSAESCRQKAIAFEKQGDFQQALMAWRAAALMAPGDRRVPEIIKTLERGIANAAKAHYKKGVIHFQNADFTAAQREFLVVLRLAPDHKKALLYLKVRLQRTDQKVYKVQRGDSFIKIATGEYNDPSKAYTIAYFNDLDPEKPLWIGTQLLLPSLSANQILPRKEIGILMARAQAALAREHYDAVLEFADEIKAWQPDNVEVLPLCDAAHYALGMARMARHNYFSALGQFKQVGDGFKGRDQAIREARRNIQRQNTEEKFRIAQDLFNNGDFVGAIKATEALLARAPGHPKATPLFDAAHYALGKQLLDQGKEVQAIEALRVLDKGYQDTAQLLSLAHARLNTMAEDCYRKGVKQFLNEELEQAIASWEKTLALNPNHPKARQDIDNALRLLEKWRGLGPGDKNGQ